MAPLKKSKSMTNKGIGAVYDTSPRKAEKSNPKKRKLSDMLGPEWSVVELQRFYEAYRKYGKTWKKVASAVRSRTADMVEALYTINRAYLSLPENLGSVSGLIAMMTDHYKLLDGSGSEKDTEDTTRMARKMQKHLKAKGRLDSKREISLQRQSNNSSDKLIRRNSLQPPSIRSTDGCLALLKKICGAQMNFPVKKRTPREPISYLEGPNKKPRRSLMNIRRDELYYGDLLLGQNPSSVDGSQTTYRSFEHLRNSQPLAEEKPKKGGYASDEESMDESLNSYDARFENLFRGSVDSRSALTEYKKGKKGKKEYENSEPKMFQSVRDSYRFSDKRSLINHRFADEGAKIDRSPSVNKRKRSNEHMIQDEFVACDALHALADLSMMMPYLATESVEKAQESVPVCGNTDDTHAPFDVALQQSPIPYKKRKTQASKTLADEDAKSKDSNAQISPVAEHCKSPVKSPGVSSSNGIGEHMVETEVAVSSTQVQSSCDAVTSTRSKSRRKRDRAIPLKDRNQAPSVFSSNSSSLFQDRVQCLKDEVSHCLSSPDVRRWCSYEWFYSAIDYPWFAKRDFVEYLNHVGLGHIPRLTRVEWGVIRSSLGKPRRFSERFLFEERDKLKQYRESVRTHYVNLRAGLGDGLPTDLARPLSVGQQVVAIHPKTREPQDGSVLAVDRQSCLIQFDREALGTEFVMDIDCMPSNPVENMPESLRRQEVSFGHRYSESPKVNGTLRLASDEHMQNTSPLCRVASFSPVVANDIKAKQVTMNSHTKITGDRSLRTMETTQSQDMAQMQPRKVDMTPILSLTRGFDKKYHPVANYGGANGVLHSSDGSMFNHDETSFNVVEIVRGSREKAHKMVDVAAKVIASMKEGEDAYGRIDKAFDSSLKTEHVTNCQGGGFPLQNPAASCSSASSDLQMPSELITSCVATLLIIRTCTERQYPPAEVAQMLDNAVTSLHPSCSQNLSVYREIQMCMGRIKTQILALVPT